MAKRLLSIMLVNIALVFVTYNLHCYAKQLQGRAYVFDLWNVYIFHGVFTLTLCVSFELMHAHATSLREQLGFIYLGSTVLKIMLFFILFPEVLLQKALFDKTNRIALLVPMAVFTFFEVVVTVKTLNR